MSGQNYCQHFDKMWENYFFVKFGDHTVCLLCGYKPAYVKKQNVLRHYLLRHKKDYDSYEDQEKLEVIEGLKLVYRECLTDAPENSSSEKARIASYAISFLLAKNSKPYNDGEFMKRCLMEVVKSFGKSMTLEELESITLSDTTVDFQISDGGVSVEESLTNITENSSLSEKACKASCAIFRQIKKRGRSNSESDFIKECLIESVKSFSNSITFREAASIPVSRSTISSRVLDINASMEEKLSIILNTSQYYSLCLDEITDKQQIGQLGIFARIVQNDFSYTEEFLDFIPLHSTTTGLDIFHELDSILQKLHTSFYKCSAIITSGAKTMTGKKVGLHGQLKSRKFTFPVIHCIVHHEALCGRDLILTVAMKKIMKIIDSVRCKSEFISNKKFVEFLETHNALLVEAPRYSEIHWLSATEYLSKFLTVRKEIVLLFQEHSMPNSQECICLLTDVSFFCELAFIIDLSNHLKTFNVELQKPDQSITQLCSTIDAFRRKLILFQNHLKDNSFYFFPTCTLISEEFGDKCNFQNHLHILNSIIDQFDKRFTDIDSLRNDLIFYENPLTVNIEEQALQYQQELCTLQNDISLKTRKEKGVEFFRTLEETKYMSLRDFALRIFSIFGSTHFCNYSFSKVHTVKTELRTMLNDSSLSAVIRVVTSKIPVDFSDLPCDPKRARKSPFLRN